MNRPLSCADSFLYGHETPKEYHGHFFCQFGLQFQRSKNLHYGENTIEMVGNIKNRGKVGLAIATLASGKTIKDLQDWPSTNQPGWLSIITFLESPSDGKNYPQTITISPDTAGPLYFVCFDEVPQSKIGALGPFEVKD